MLFYRFITFYLMFNPELDYNNFSPNSLSIYFKKCPTDKPDHPLPKSNHHMPPYSPHQRKKKLTQVSKLLMKRCWRREAKDMRRLKANFCSGSKDAAGIVIRE